MNDFPAEKARKRVLQDPNSLTYGPEERVIVGDTRQLVYGECRLCLSEKRLVHGHIIPAWAERMLSGTPIATARNGRVAYEVTQRPAEYMFCGACDNHIGEGENYLAKLCRGRRSDLEPIGVSVRGGLLSGIDRNLTLRGLLGIIIKIHFSTQTSYQKERLDEIFAQRLRTRILRDDYPDHGYSVTAIKWMLNTGFPGYPRDVMHGFFRHGRVNYAQIMMGGVTFYIVFRHPEQFTEWQHLAIPSIQGGGWQWLVGGLEKCFWMLDKLDRDYDDSGFEAWDSDSVDDDDPCPCDIRPSIAKKECCGQGRWID